MKFKKLLSIVICTAMLISLIPASLFVQAADTSKYEFKYVLYSQTAKGKHCGTGNNNLKGRVYFYGESSPKDNYGVTKKNATHIEFKVEKSQDNGEAMGTSSSTRIPPWRVSSYMLKNNNSDAYRAHALKLCVEVYNGNKKVGSYQIGKTYYPKGSSDNTKGKWIDSTDEHADDIQVTIGEGQGPQTRKPTEINGWEAFGNTTYIDPGYTGNDVIKMELPGTLKGDRYNGMFGGSYNMFDWAEAGRMSLKITGTAVDGSVVDEKALTSKDVGAFERITVNDTYDYVSGWKINKQKLISYMNKKGINKIEITSKLYFPWWTFDDANFKSAAAEKKSGFVGNDEFHKTYTIYRNAFEVWNVKLKPKDGKLFERNADNKYFNAGTTTIQADVDVYYHNNDTSTTSSENRNNTWNHFGKGFLDGKTVKFSSTPKLQIGSQNKYLTATSNTATFNSTSDFSLYFELPEGTIDSEDVGLTLILEGAYFEANGQKYYLTDTQYDYTAPPSNDKRTKGNASYLISTHKADNIMPTANFTFDEDEPSVNGWRKRAVLDYTVSEDLYTGNEASDIATLNYRLRSKENPDVFYNITNKDGTGKMIVGEHMATESSASTIIVANADGQKEIEGVLELVDTTDIAGNNATAVIDDVKLDNLAPRVTIVKNEEGKAADGSKSTKFTFNIEDASKSGKVYYAFADSASQMPEFDSGDVEDGSGEIENLLDRWAFILQNEDDTANGTALLKVKNGEFFTGKMYWFSEDGLGNRTDISSVDVSIYNENTEYDIFASGDTGYPQKDYEINITSAGNTIYWRWQHPEGNGAIADFKEYKSAAEVGKGVQKDSRGNEVVLDGPCTLEFKIKTAAGTETTYTKQFVFDNAAPTVGFTNANSGTYRSSQTITAKADDSSGIKKATAQLLHYDESEVSGHGEFELTLTDGLLNDKITVTNVPAGAYRLKVTAIDNNGYETTEISNPFFVRNEAPEASISVDSDKTYEDAPLLSQNEYELKISVKESFKGAFGTQNVYYRAADSTQEYGAWVNGGKMMAAADGFELDFTADTPVKLTEGINNIYVQVIITPEGVDPANLTGQNIIATKEVVMYCDTTPAGYRLDLNDTHTNETIIGSLILSDNLGGELTVDTNGIDESVLAVSETDTEDVFSITVSENIENSIYVIDAAGNETEIPIKISGIDTEAPDVSAFDAEDDIVGERTFATANITVSDADEGTVMFAIIPEADLNRAKNTDGTIKDEYFEEAHIDNDEITVLVSDIIKRISSTWDNEETITYQVTLRGIDGAYYIGVRAADILGNTSDTIFDDFTLEPQDAEAEITEFSVSPEKAYDKSIAYVNFNVPVSVLPQNMITKTAADGYTVEETNLENARKYANGYSLDYSFGITQTGNYKLYIADELGRTKVLEVNVTDSDVTFGEELDVKVETVEYTGSAGSDWMEVFVESTRVITGDELVIPGDIDQRIYTVIEVTPSGEYTLSPVYETSQFGGTMWDEEEAILFWEEQSEQDDKGNYTKLVYMTDYVYDEIETESGHYRVYPHKPYRAIDVNVIDSVDNSLTPYTVYAGNIDNTPPEGTVTVYPQTARDDEGYPLNYTLGGVSADVTFSEPQVGVDYVEFSAYGEYGGEERTEMYNLTIPFRDESGNAIDYSEAPYTFENDCVSITINGDADLKSVKTASILFKTNAYASFTVVSTIGASGYLGIDNEGSFNIDYINNSDITDSDYTVSYYYMDENGEWKPITDGIYYKNAKAVIEATEKGTERGIYVYNNGRSNEKLLDFFDRSFTFVLSDNYGYKHEVPVELSTFDITPGNININLEVNGKTNQPVPVTITVSDDESGIGKVTLARGTDDIPLTDNGSGVYTGYVSNIGNHIVTFTDKAGNVAQKVFMVADIDSTLPEIAEIEYNETERTSKTVSAAIKYTKPNVTLTRVEVASGLTSDDYTVDYANSTIRFHESGSLSVWFKDDYGNENSGVVTVSNIYKTPPALEAVATVADDKMSVDIRFEKALDDTGAEIDPLRDLSEIMVSYNGVVRLAEDENGEKAVYTFTDNGKYTFKVYDDEGVSSYLTIEISGIDKSAPKITLIRWSYDYDVFVNGQWVSKKAEGTRDVENESGYRIATDVNPITNKNVDVTVVTDSETTIMGDTDSEPSTEHTLTYQENGMYIFNMEKANGLADSYGFDVAVIDKTPPVIELANAELIFYENQTSNPVQYSKDLIDKPGEAFRAYDVFGGEIDLTDRVIIDYGTFNPDDITQNTFDRTKPYTITYTVSDDAHNITEAKLTVRLVGYFDTIALINGSLPDYAGRKEVNGEEIIISLKNFSGVSYARVEKGIQTMGQMKKTGTVLAETASGSGEYKFTPDDDGWYTILVQTDKRDYFNLQVYIWN